MTRVGKPQPQKLPPRNRSLQDMLCKKTILLMSDKSLLRSLFGSMKQQDSSGPPCIKLLVEMLSPRDSNSQQHISHWEARAQRLHSRSLLGK